MRPLTLDGVVGQKILGSFTGKEDFPEAMGAAIRKGEVGGITLFRHANIDQPEQVRALTTSLQDLAIKAKQPILIIAADQEGGQLMAVEQGATRFPGNLALGATRSTELAYQVGYALGRELAAMGINVNYAPVCDVNVNPENPVIGTRSFGEDPQLVSRLAAAQIAGLQAAGVAATAKHFPGHGDTASDFHFGTPQVNHARERLHEVELLPFETAIASDVKLVMSAHIALPALTGDPSLPATLSPQVLRGLLRDEMKFTGVIVSDALDMRAIGQGDKLASEAIAAISAGVDLLLFQHPLEVLNAVFRAIVEACRQGDLDESDLRASAARVLNLKAWLAAQTQPDLSVVGCSEHQALALEVAQHALTLVRDHQGLLPLSLDAEQRVGVFLPQPEDLTPADTSSYVTPDLASYLRSYHPQVDQWIYPLSPSPEERAQLTEGAREYDLLIVGTIDAKNQHAQAELVKGLAALEIPLIVAALRMPYDLASFPEVSTYLCTYSVQPPAMQALAQGLFGEIPWRGQLPVTIPGKWVEEEP